jgi:polysaccharide biosynthesis transport protein
MIRTFEPGMDIDERSNDLDLGALGSAIYRKRSWIIVPTALVFVMTLVFVNVVRPVYTAQAQVLLENQENFINTPRRTEIQQETDTGADEDLVNSQIQLVTSPDLARRAIDDLGLIGNPEFDPYAHGLGVVSDLLVALGLMRDPMQTPAEDRILAKFERKLQVYAPIKTRVLVIEFSSRDPQLAARGANEVATLYLQMQSNAKREIAKQAAASLAVQIADLKAKAAHAADEVERYRAASGLLAGTNNMTIAGQQLADLNGELSHARSEAADSQAKATLIQDMLREGRISEVPDVANNDLIRRIAEQLVTAKAQLALESGTLLPGHPRIKELNAEIANLEVQLQTTAESVAEALSNDAKIATARVANLETTIDAQKSAVDVSNVDEVRLRELQTVAQALRDQLDLSMTKYQEAVAAEYSTSTPADARIIAQAIPPQEPSFPKKVPMVSVATLAAFILSLGVVIGSELLSDQPQQPRPAQEPYGDAPASGIERARVKRFGRFVPDDGEDEISETLGDEDDDSGAKIVSRAAGSHGVQVVTTRTSDSDASNAAVIGFARNLAREGRPIIIDLDSEARQVASLFATADAGKTAGLTDLLEGKASFADVIHRDCASRLHFVPFGSAEEFDPGDLDLILDALTQTYDFVILAAPSMGTSEMPKALAPYADFVVLAMSDKDEAATETARTTLKDAGAAEVLVIDNEMTPA